MKIKSSKFVLSAKTVLQAPAVKLPEVAISGRSNVGKSSLINNILNRKNLAKISSTPGKTRMINYFLINEKFYLVDLPGYGYSSASKKEMNEWKQSIEEFLQKSENLKLVLQLIDIRHELKNNDRIMVDYLEHYKIPYKIILTKSDKISSGKLKQQAGYFSDIFKSDEIIITSSIKGIGKNKVLEAILSQV